MDARITKHRLATLLSYDWLKMLVTIVIAVFLVVVVFLVSATRVGNAQTFTVYAYIDLSAGRDFNTLADTLKQDGVFSYDILKTEAESFSEDSSFDLFSLRRSTGAGTVMFISDVRVYETDDDGNPVYNEDGTQTVETESALYSLARYGAVQPDHYASGIVYDTKYYMTMCEDYLEGFFGEGLAGGEPDAEKVRESFYARNENDKRFKTAAARERGVGEERQRLIGLKEDFLFVQELFAQGVYTHTEYELTEDGETYTSAMGINVGGLDSITDLVYYTDSEGKTVGEKLNLVILYNDFHESNGLLYEPITFLRWLYEEYDEGHTA